MLCSSRRHYEALILDSLGFQIGVKFKNVKVCRAQRLLIDDRFDSRWTVVAWTVVATGDGWWFMAVVTSQEKPSESSPQGSELVEITPAPSGENRLIKQFRYEFPTCCGSLLRKYVSAYLHSPHRGYPP